METVEKKVDLVDDKPQVVNADLRKFNKTEQMVTKAVDALKGCVAVDNAESCELALQTLKEAKTVENAIEKKRKDLVKPFNDSVKKINNHAKELVEKLPIEISRVKQLVVDYQTEEERKEAEARKQARIQQLTNLGFVQGDGYYSYDGNLIIVLSNIENFEENAWINLITETIGKIEMINNSKLQAKEQELEEVAFFGNDEQLSETINEVETLATKTISVGEVGPVAEATKVKGITKRWVFEVTDAHLVPREYLVVDEKKIREAVSTGTRLIPGVRIYQESGLTIR